MSRTRFQLWLGVFKIVCMIEMKQAFDLVSHFFASLPISVLISTIKNTGSDSEKILLIALIIAVGCSLAYHSVDSTFESYDYLHAIDRFTSSAIILLTFWLYIDRFENWITIIVLVMVLVFVLLEARYDFPALAVEGIVLGLVIIAIVVFILKKYGILEQDEKRKRIYRLRDPFFLSFFLTQILAIVFFAVDTDPYFHSLWHLFAFISLGSVLIHSLPEDEKNKYGGCTKEYFVDLTYWLGSLPSRLFISWIFIHMGEGEGWPLGIVFLCLWLIMVGGLCKKKNPEMMTERRKYTMKKGAVTYLCMFSFLFAQMIGAAGWILLGDTILSAFIWVYYKQKQAREPFYSPVPRNKELRNPTLNLNNMVF